MQILHPHREAAKLIVTGAVIVGFGIYGIRIGTYGTYLQKFKLWGLRQYTRDPQPADRRMYQIAGALGVVAGLAAIGIGIHALVTR